METLKNSKKLVLTSPIKEISGIGEKRLSAFCKLRLSTVMDFLKIRPKRYEDRSRIIPFSSLVPEKFSQGVFVGVLTDTSLSFFGPRKCILICDFQDDFGNTAKARWFNQPYLIKNLEKGQKYYLFGEGFLFKQKPALDNPEIEPFKDENEPPCEGILTPVYSSSKAFSEVKLSPRVLRKIILDMLGKIIWEESFPSLKTETPFPKIRKAIIDLHSPKTLEDANAAARTLGFLDQLLFQMAVLKRRERFCGKIENENEETKSEFQWKSGENIEQYMARLNPTFKDHIAESFGLPFELTASQKTALSEVSFLISKKHPSNIMLQGDVGCGKTIVSFIASIIFFTRIQPGSLVAMMAPTEPLTAQHFRKFKEFFPNFSKNIAILTGDTSSLEREKLNKKLESGEISILFGTHALFQEKVKLPRLGFCIIDEQQRFGVEQRKALLKKASDAENHLPHLLMISATPIPRTLSLTIFGDLDLITISEKPVGRKVVQTKIVFSREEILKEIKFHVESDGQVYFLCPLIEESDKSTFASVKEAGEFFQKYFSKNLIGTLSGRLKSDEKNRVLEDFNSNRIKVLVTTTVIEVGIDNPNAGLMVVENAERFGLSQLHQLRGRVGRGSRDSQCILICSNKDALSKINVLMESDDGFRIALEDLKNRGPGDLCGVRQSGLNHPAMETLENPEQILKARRRALEILTQSNHDTQSWFLDRMRESFGESFQEFMEGG
ncbi:MAG: ATP-dependent DNA helicase RecG [Candidatus Riflebacteria bacterium]|nr:ATP-dependent DNA helicase RecG [Candidatus Riflebacteria bacterium]